MSAGFGISDVNFVFVEIDYFVSDNGRYSYHLNKNERKEIIFDCQNNLSHVGVEKVHENLKKDYFWANMKMDIKTAVCAHTKFNDYGVTPLNISIVSFPFRRIGIDLAWPLPVSKDGFKYILGFIDYFSKYPMLIPLRSTDSQTIAKTLFDRWISVFGCPV